jgi:hypothetical protein
MIFSLEQNAKIVIGTWDITSAEACRRYRAFILESELRPRDLVDLEEISFGSEVGDLRDSSYADVGAGSPS